MGLEDLAKYIGRVVVAKMQGNDVGMDRLKAVAGELVSVSVNWASEYNMLFRGGDRVALLKDDLVIIDGEAFKLR